MVEDQLTRVALDDEIRERVRDRRWYRAHRWTQFLVLESENTIALRALLRVRSRARRASRASEAAHVAWFECQHELGQSDCEKCGWMAEML